MMHVQNAAKTGAITNNQENAQLMGKPQKQTKCQSPNIKKLKGSVCEFIIRI